MLTPEIRKTIEPEVREAVARLMVLKKAIADGADTETLNQLGYQVEYALGSMLPPVVATFSAEFSAALLNRTPVAPRQAAT